MAERDAATSDHPFTSSVRRAVHDTFVTGLAVVVPMLVTIMVISFVFNYIYRYIDMFSGPLSTLPVFSGQSGVLNISPDVLVDILVPVAFVALVFLVGAVVRGSTYGERGVDYFDHLVELLPGVGSVYESFRQMSDVMLESDSESFREVKLVEFPSEGAYTLGFVTTETPPALADPAGHDEMLTMFLPLAPNPIMGGHLVHMPTDRVVDVDMSVEEGIQAIVTSGVAIGELDHEVRAEGGVSAERLRKLTLEAHDDGTFRGGGVPVDAGKE